MGRCTRLMRQVLPHEYETVLAGSSIRQHMRNFVISTEGRNPVAQAVKDFTRRSRRGFLGKRSTRWRA